METKRCNRCGEDKAEAEWAPSQWAKGGWCKECYRVWHRSRYTPKNHESDAPRDCAHCGASYQPQTRRASKFCSFSCKDRFYKEALAAKRRAVKAGRTCKHCGQPLPAGARADAVWCPEGTCSTRQRTPEQRRRYRLWSKYRITAEDYDAMLVKQGGVCAICGSGEPNTSHGFWHVDHCHDSDKVRGLLCSTCNTGLGSFYDRPDVLIRAAEYLVRAKETEGA